MNKIKIIDISNKELKGQQPSNPYFFNRMNDYKLNCDKKSVIYSYIALKTLLKSLNIDLDQIEIVLDKNGKPVFKDKSLKIHFNISHSHNLVVVAVSDHPIGIDVQKFSKPNHKIIKRYFNAYQQTMLKQTINQTALYTKYWTVFESELKLFGNIKTKNTNTTEIYHKSKTLTDEHDNKYYLTISSTLKFK